MKLTIDRDVLADAVAWTAHALPHRPSAPVLAGLLLDASADGLTISAFDYDTSRRTTTAADVAEPGRVLLPGRVLAEVVKALPKQQVTIALSGTEVTISCGNAEFALLTMPVEDYPKLPEPPDAVGEVDAQQLAAAVAQVAPAASRDETLPMLTGMRVDTDAGHLTLAATDRYRIAARDLTWQPTTPGAGVGVMIPGRLLHDITKSLPAGEATIGVGDSLASLQTSGRTTTVRLLDPQFIDYRARLNIDYPIWAEVTAAELTAAVKRVTLVAERGNNGVRLAFADGQVTVRAGGADTGRGTEVLDADLDGDAIEIAFQAPLLLDGLAGVDGRARIGMTTPAKPALILPAGADDPDYRYLVMALRLS
ncbi:DNA polymerase III, beta subunit [Streptosporangium canum]|uniref:Beta sliding clamp n=1 Tax=Streptosporangium canum TaxID=324952 RepID=A0A1I4DG37_9ACTN|nr:DNA polymerase III subunit beta [Streptosporangium canum]SFK92013.1 DNA polymerase III, beta subunit [Streptosporangium canum]